MVEEGLYSTPHMVPSMPRKVTQGTQEIKLVLPKRWIRQLDHLVKQGLFLNRADVIRRAIDVLLKNHPEVQRIE